MQKFSTGNVFKLERSIYIVTMVDSELTHWVDFSYSNSSGSFPNITKLKNMQCFKCNTNDSNEPDYDCDICKGSGYYVSEYTGMDRAVFLASNVKEYILSRLTKNFDF